MIALCQKRKKKKKRKKNTAHILINEKVKSANVMILSFLSGSKTKKIKRQIFYSFGNNTLINLQVFSVQEQPENLEEVRV